MNLQEQTNRIRQMMGLITEQEISPCQKQLNADLPVARKKWESWLSNPATKQKFMANHELDETKTNEIFSKYSESLAKTQVIPFKDVETKPKFNYQKEVIKFIKKYGDGLYGLTLKEVPNTIFVNCEKTSQSYLETIEHEFSHVLDNIYKKNPFEKVSTLYGSQKIQKQLNRTNLDDFFRKANITDENRKNKITSYFQELMEDPKLIKKYRCRESENLVAIHKLREVLNKESGEDITLEDVIPYFTLEKEAAHLDIDKLVACWVYKGLPDITNYLNQLNTLAKNKSQQNINAV